MMMMTSVSPGHGVVHYCQTLRVQLPRHQLSQDNQEACCNMCTMCGRKLAFVNQRCWQLQTCAMSCTCAAPTTRFTKPITTTRPRSFNQAACTAHVHAFSCQTTNPAQRISRALLKPLSHPDRSPGPLSYTESHPYEQLTRCCCHKSAITTAHLHTVLSSCTFQCKH
jgi:hypothetical protein